MVVGFHLHQDMDRLLVEGVFAAVGLRIKTPGLGTANYRSVVRVGRQHVVPRLGVGIFDHLEQGQRLVLAIQGPARIEDLVATVFGVRLGEHHQFDIGGIAAQLAEILEQVVDLVLGERETQFGVCDLESDASATGDIDHMQRARLMLFKQHRRLVQTGVNHFHHPVVQQRQYRLGIEVTLQVVRHTAFNTADFVQAGVMSNIGSFGRPGRNGAWTGHSKQKPAV